MDLSSIDPKLLEAFADFIRKKQEEDKAKPTVRELWHLWFDAVGKDLPGRVVIGCARDPLLETTLVYPGGQQVKLGDLPWDAMTPKAAALWRTARGKQVNRHKNAGKPPSPSYINRQLTILQGALNYAVPDVIPYNPVAGWARVNEDQYARQTFLTPAEFERYISGGHPLFQDVMRVANRCCGMRPSSEARLLLKSEVHFETRTIRLDPRRVKNRKTAPIPIPKDIVPILERHCANSLGSHVFVDPADPNRSEPLSYGKFIRMAARARKRSGIKGTNGEEVVPHSAGRHSGITAALADGADAWDVARVARVSPRIMAKVYDHFEKKRQERLRAVLDRELPELAAERKGPQKSTVEKSQDFQNGDADSRVNPQDVIERHRG